MSRSSPHIKIFFGALVLLMVAVAAFVYQRSNLETIDAEISSTVAQIKSAYGIEVHYRYDPRLFFSREDLYAPESAQGSQISLTHVKSLLPVVEQFLSTYPKELVKKNLSAIYLTGKLEFYGKAYGGTAIKSTIYVSTKGSFFRYINSSVLGLMHAEFSSILFRKYAFPKEAWKAVNKPSWTYPESDEGSGFKMLGQHDSYDQTEELLRDGFLEKFSQADLENDFNTFVDWAFAKPDRLRELVSRYDRLKNKCKLVVQFYKSIDPRIDIPTVCQNLTETSG